MNEISQVTTLLTSVEESSSQQLFALLAQTAPPPTTDPLARTGAAVESGVDYMQNLERSLIAFIPNLLAAVLILALGLIIAAIAKSVVRAILNRTDILSIRIVIRRDRCR